MQLPMVFLDNNLSIRNFTPSATELFSLRESDVGRPITDITSRLDYQRLDDDIREVRHTQQGLDREVVAVNGHAYIMRVLLYRTTEDVIDGIILTFTDITERRRSEEHQKMLVAELSHRVKNMLATVQAIALQTIRGASSLDAFGETFMGRITALSAAHSLLTASDWQGARLHAVIAGALEAYRGTGERIAIHGEDFPLSPRAALTLSLIVNELSTNAAKYGALSSPAGRVDVETSMRDGDPRPAVAIVWRERTARRSSGRPSGLRDRPDRAERKLRAGRHGEGRVPARRGALRDRHSLRRAEFPGRLSDDAQGDKVCRSMWFEVAPHVAAQPRSTLSICAAGDCLLFW